MNNIFHYFDDAECVSLAVKLYRLKGTHPAQLMLSGLTFGEGIQNSSKVAVVEQPYNKWPEFLTTLMETVTSQQLDDVVEK